MARFSGFPRFLDSETAIGHKVKKAVGRRALQGPAGVGGRAAAMPAGAPIFSFSCALSFMGNEIIDPASLHEPVLLPQVLEALSPKPGGRYLDATLGMGGHAKAVLEAAEGSALCGLDQDERALELARLRLSGFGDRARFFHLPFASFQEALNELEWGSLDGALADIGVSSFQLDSPERGFSFLENGPLDMRMNPLPGQKTAADIVSRASFDELKNMIAMYGEDPQAGRIAGRIIEERRKAPIKETGRLAEIVKSAYPAAWRRDSRRHPATRTFQALRIAVNDELGQLERFLNGILPYLKPGARLAVITFHSLEDRIVKNTMRRWARSCVCPPSALICSCGHKPEARILYKKPLIADKEEIAKNPRSSSAKLRAAEKLAGN